MDIKAAPEIQPEQIQVEVIYALPGQQPLVSISLPAGSTAQQAVEKSGLLERFPEINIEKNRLGIYARLIKIDTPLRDRDRVEIYRPLIADPKEIRKQRAAAGKSMTKGKTPE